MHGNQFELFKDNSESLKPSADFAQFRIGKKIIQVPCSFWKDGRIRADLSAYGSAPVVSRNGANLQERVIGVLREAFGTIVEAVCQEFSRSCPRTLRPRLSNKLPAIEQASVPLDRDYINPFAENWTFGKCPDWLLTRREPTAVEKHIYGKLLYPAKPISGRWDQKSGVIFELNQGELAKAIGISRPAVNRGLMSLRRRGLLEVTGRPGAKQVIRFLRHEWITCNLRAQVGRKAAVNGDNRSCPPSDQAAVIFADSACPVNAQLPEGIEKREPEKKDKRNVRTFSF